MNNTWFDSIWLPAERINDLISINNAAFITWFHKHKNELKVRYLLPESGKNHPNKALYLIGNIRDVASNLGDSVDCRSYATSYISMLSKQAENLNNSISKLRKQQEMLVELKSQAVEQLSYGVKSMLFHRDYAPNSIVERSIPYKHRVGVYFLIKDKEIVYVGQSIKVHCRLYEHYRGTKHQFDSVSVIETSSDALDFVESFYIHMLKPKGNRKVDQSHVRKYTRLHYDAPMNLSQLTDAVRSAGLFHDL